MTPPLRSKSHQIVVITGFLSVTLHNHFLYIRRRDIAATLEERGIRYVRYADDFLLFAKTEEEIKRAAEIIQTKLQELELEVAIEKTKTVIFNVDHFDFLGFTF